MDRVKKWYMLYFFILLTCIVIVFTLSIVNFKYHYTFDRYQISHLGLKELNPQFFSLFNMSMKLLGFALVPFLIQSYRYYTNYMRITSQIALTFGILGSVGTSLIGFIHVDNWNLHWAIAQFTFICFYAYFVVLCVIWINIIMKNKKLISNIIFFTGQIFLFTTLIGILIFMSTLAEWLYFIAILLNLFLSFVLVNYCY